jgi:hypothetical protein
MNLVYENRTPCHYFGPHTPSLLKIRTLPPTYLSPPISIPDNIKQKKSQFSSTPLLYSSTAKKPPKIRP